MKEDEEMAELQRKKLLRAQYDAVGTPMAVKTPIDFQKRLKEQEIEQKQAVKKLCIATSVSCVFIFAELVGGWWAGSIAIMADAAHLSSDIFGFGVSIIALRLGQKDACDHLTYGWNRAEIIGTMVSISTIWVMTVWLFIEATWRFFEEP